MIQILEKTYRACLRSGLVTPGIHRTAKRMHSWLRYSRSQMYLLEDINSLRAGIVDLKREQDDLRTQLAQLKAQLASKTDDAPAQTGSGRQDVERPR
ncbi:MAG: hypothetical protein E2576_00585 [Alcaligenaceae bacterium]|nr:hypothetical protein [Alcaligenaceae bacterium SAGV5]MPS51779.1 hypothetical protein [Alcaligenaceae bacterium SAGV3]MPT55194.1 hypothetical protein [Alcaligenaceae bacterium]